MQHGTCSLVIYVERNDEKRKIMKPDFIFHSIFALRNVRDLIATQNCLDNNSKLIIARRRRRLLYILSLNYYYTRKNQVHSTSKWWSRWFNSLSHFFLFSDIYWSLYFAQLCENNTFASFLHEIGSCVTLTDELYTNKFYMITWTMNLNLKEENRVLKFL